MIDFLGLIVNLFNLIIKIVELLLNNLSKRKRKTKKNNRHTSN